MEPNEYRDKIEAATFGQGGVARGLLAGACEPSNLSREGNAWTSYGSFLLQLEAVKCRFDDAGLEYPALLAAALAMARTEPKAKE